MGHYRFMHDKKKKKKKKKKSTPTPTAVHRNIISNYFQDNKVHQSKTELETIGPKTFQPNHWPYSRLKPGN